VADEGLLFQSALSLARAIRARELSPVELLEASLRRVDEVNDKLNAVIWRNDEEALEVARRAENEVLSAESPDDLPPFCGVPIPIKDLTPVEGWPLTYGSGAVPDKLAGESELIVEALRRAGFVLTGLTNVPEFGPLTVSENLRHGVTRNPWDFERTPGGSSGGAAAAVAAGMFSVAQGNDGGGSIRVPASCCGLVGLKVSRGRIPTLYMSWEGATVPGVLTADVASTAALLDVTSGPDPNQWYNAPAPERPFSHELGAPPGRLRVALVEDAPFGLPMAETCAAAAKEAGEALEALGHVVQTLPAAEVIDVPDEFITAFLNVSNTGLADYEGVDWGKAEPHTQANRSVAMAVDSLTYVSSVHLLQRYSRKLVSRWGNDWDILLTPTMTIEPPRAGDVLRAVHGSAGSGAPALEVFQMAVLASAFNVTGQPAISLPTHMSLGRVPIGVQLVTGPWQEALLLRAAAQLEEALPWVGRRPPL